MEKITLCSPEHQEVFQRVWARVMGSAPDCPAPIPEGMEGDLSCRQLAQLSQQNVDSLSQASQSEPAPAAAQAQGDAPRLRRQVQQALERWQCYRMLARRHRGRVGSLLEHLATDQHRMARRLSAAYFLLTGVRYWPVGALPTPAPLPLWAGLRRCHQDEAQAGTDYLSCAGSAADPALPELYRQLSQDCREHCRRLRALLELDIR